MRGKVHIVGIDAFNVIGSVVEGFPDVADVSVSNRYIGIRAHRVVDCTVRELRATGTSDIARLFGIEGVEVTGCLVERVQGAGNLPASRTAGIRSGSITATSDLAGSGDAATFRFNTVAGIAGTGIVSTATGIVEANRVAGAVTGISSGFGRVVDNVVSDAATGITKFSGIATGNTAQNISGTAFAFGDKVRSGPTLAGGGAGSAFDPNANFVF